MTTDRGFDVPTAGALPEQTGKAFSRLVELMQRLLAPDGCPWDREQDERSLRPYVLEEAAEVVDAIEDGDDEGLREELGDLSLQVAFLSELARRRGAFGPDDVFVSICEKMVRRHPHVFDDASVSGSDDVIRNWELIKAREKPAQRKGVLGKLPRSQASLHRARLLSERAASVGFDWETADAARAKVVEEWEELDAAIAAKERAAEREEFGDLLFALVNWARHLGIDAELALRDASSKFERRFAELERAVQDDGGFPTNAQGKPTRGVTPQQLEAYWQQAKRKCE